MNFISTFQTPLHSYTKSETNLTTDIIISKEASAICTTIILCIISIIGIVGNSLVVWAFKKKVVEGVISCLLILLLACCDLMICLTVIPSTLYLDVWLAHTADWVCRMHLALKGFIVPVSASLLVLIAVERFLLICFIPGIPLRKMQLIASIVSILIFGILLAIPMGLHVRATDRRKFKDELLNLDYMDNTLLNKAFKERDVSKRCHKDDTYISDDLYWYYQLFVSVLFVGLFLTIAVIYLIIFIFVRRHESLMYEKYGSSDRRGCWIRVQAIPTSSTCPKKEEPFKPMGEILDNSTLNQVSNQQCKPSLPAKNFELESLHCVCSCANIGGNGFEDLHKTNSACEITYPMIPSSSQPQQQLISVSKTVSVQETQFRWAAANMERKRRPHVKTAQTLALITATFIVSYTPYLVSTIKPVDERLVKRISQHPTWFDEIRSVLFYLYFINSAINPVIYSCMNHHYQSRVNSLLNRICWGRKNESHEAELIFNESSHPNVIQNKNRSKEINHEQYTNYNNKDVS